MKRTEVRILLVDDRESDLELIADQLGFIGYKNIKTAISGEDAISKIKKYVPHVVLMDTDMGIGIKGYEACKKIRSLFSGNIIIIGMSDHYTEERISLWKDAGVNYFYDKSDVTVKNTAYNTLDKELQVT